MVSNENISPVPLYCINLQYDLPDAKVISLVHKYDRVTDISTWKTAIHISPSEANDIMLNIYKHVRNLYPHYRLMSEYYYENMKAMERVVGIVDHSTFIDYGNEDMVLYKQLHDCILPLVVLNRVILHVHLNIDLDDDSMTSTIQASYTAIIYDEILDRVIIK